MRTDMKKNILYFYLFLCVALTSCATQTAVIAGGQGVVAKEEVQPFFVYGISQTQSINAAQVCGSADRVVKVERSQSLLNGFLRFISQGIYTPYDAKVYCSS